MRIVELIDKRSVKLDAAPKTKSEALEMAVDLMAAAGKDIPVIIMEPLTGGKLVDL